MNKCKFCKQESPNIVGDICVDCLADRWGEIVEYPKLYNIPFILTELFGNSQETRILEIFVENPDDEFLLHQVALMAEVGYHGVVWKHIMVLVDAGIVTERAYKEFDNNIVIYKLNTNNVIAKILITLERTMVSSALDKRI